VTENVFSQFCYKTLPNPSHLWLFKKQLCMQMALSGADSAACQTLTACSRLLLVTSACPSQTKCNCGL